MCVHPKSDWRDTADAERPHYVRTTCRACGKFLGYRDLMKTGEMPKAGGTHVPSKRRKRKGQAAGA